MAEITVIVMIIAVRIFVPFSILKWPFWGMIASIAADTFDLTLLKLFGLETFGFAGYQLTDKLLDIYYLSFGLYATAGLKEVFARRTLRVLFFWRFAGVIIFEVTGFRWLLFAAPNIFENLYLGVFGAKKFFNTKITPRTTVVLLLAATLLKLPQEYVMHYLEFPWGIGNFPQGLRRLIQ